MDLIYKIYESEYFVIGLFSVIAVLTLLFIIIAIMGRKDKNNKNNEISSENITEDTKNNTSIENIADSFKEVEEKPVAIDVPVETIEPLSQNEAVIEEIDVFTSNYTAPEAPVVEPITMEMDSIVEEVQKVEAIDSLDNTEVVNVFDNVSNEMPITKEESESPIVVDAVISENLYENEIPEVEDIIGDFDPKTLTSVFQEEKPSIVNANNQFSSVFGPTSSEEEQEELPKAIPTEEAKPIIEPVKETLFGGVELESYDVDNGQ